MSTMSKDDLKKVLEVLLREMQKNGIKLELNNENKEKLLDDVAQNLRDENVLKKNDIHDPAIKKFLCLALISEHAAKKDPELQFDYKKFLKDHSQSSKEEIKNDLKPELKKLFKALNKKLDPKKRLPEKQLDALVDKKADELTDRFMKQSSQKRLSENNDVLDELTVGLIAFLGVNPFKPGAPKPTVQQEPGNAMAIADMQGGNETSLAASDSQSTYNPKEDPYGAESIILGRTKSLGSPIDTMVEIMENSLDNEGAYSNAPRYVPPGTA